MTIAFFPTNAPLSISISLLLAAALLFEYPMHQIILAVPQPSQLPPSLPPPHPQSSQQQTLHSNTFFHTPSPTSITTATSNILNGTTLFNLQSHLINSVFKKVQNSIVQVTS